MDRPRPTLAQRSRRGGGHIINAYQIEKTVRGKDPAVRMAIRREQSAPIISALKPWLETQLSRIPRKSLLAEDIRYTLAHWPGLIRFIDDGTLELDTNPVENQIRPIALTRKNALFAGNEIGAENWAMLASLVATCKLSGVNPVDYLADTLRAILDGHPRSRIEDLMPWCYDKRQASLHRASSSRLRCKALARHIVHHVQHPEAPPAGELVMHEVERPARIGPRLHQDRGPCADGLAACFAFTHR